MRHLVIGALLVAATAQGGCGSDATTRASATEKVVIGCLEKRGATVIRQPRNNADAPEIRVETKNGVVFTVLFTGSFKKGNEALQRLMHSQATAGKGWRTAEVNEDGTVVFAGPSGSHRGRSVNEAQAVARRCA